MSMSFGSRTLEEAERRFAWQVRKLWYGEAWSDCMWQRFTSDDECAYAIVVGWWGDELMACVGAIPLEHMDEAGDSIENWTPIYDPDEGDRLPAVHVSPKNSHGIFRLLWDRAVRLHALWWEDPDAIWWDVDWWDDDHGPAARLERGIGSEAVNAWLRDNCPQVFR